MSKTSDPHSYPAPRPGFLLAGILALTLTVCAGSWLTVSASADISFCPHGAGAAQCNDPGGVAINQTTGRIYVADNHNNRVDAFAEDGSFLFAFGWGVSNGAAEAQRCGPVACLAGLAGAGTGQFNHPRWIAVDGAGDVYVGTDGFRVQKFDAEGNFLRAFGWGVANGAPEAQVCTASCRAGIKGEGQGQFDGAVSPLAIGPGETVYVGDSEFGQPVRLERFDTSGSFLGECTLPVAVVSGGMAVDPVTGDVYATAGGNGGIRKFHPDCSEYAAPYPLDANTGVESKTVAIDGVGDVYAEQLESRQGGGGAHAIAKYSPGGTILSRFGYGKIAEITTGLAVHESADGNLVLFSQPAEVAEDALGYLTPPPAGPIAAPPTVEVFEIGSAKAKVRAEINPEGEAVTYHFEYVEASVCEEDEKALGPDHCFDHATKTQDKSLGSEGFRLHLAEATVIGCPNPAEEALEPVNNCLTPKASYRFRVVSSSPGGPGEGTAEGPAFETHTLEVEAAWASLVGTDTATLNATVNPHGVPATGYFEYVKASVCEEDEKALGPDHCFDHATQVPDAAGGESPLSFGAGEAGVSRSEGLYPLPAGTAYRYRVVASNPLSTELVQSPVQSITTKTTEAPIEGCPNDSSRIGAGAYLPDCRAYELVSPLDKNYGNIVPNTGLNTANSPGGLEETSVSGDRLAYSSSTAFGDAQSAPWTSQYIAQRVAGSAWVTHGITPPRGRLVPGSQLGILQLDTEFKYFSPDLCQAWLRTVTDASLDPAAVPNTLDLYRREDRLCGESAQDRYEALTTISPPPSEFPATGLELQGVSADGGTVIYATADSLIKTGAPASLQGKGHLYVRGPDGQTRFVCFLPGGAPTSCMAGTTWEGYPGHISSRQGAISADGKRIFWSAPPSGSNNTFYVGEGRVYVRENPLATGAENCATPSSAPCTRAVSAAGEALSGTNSSHFLMASSSGSQVLFLTRGSNGSVSDLYEYDVGAEATHRISSKVSGILGASEDASIIYFLSTEALAGAAQAGDVNLYRYDAAASGSPYRFIAKLVAADTFDSEKHGGASSGTNPLSPVSEFPINHSARVSADGSHLAFISMGSPTGYDNTDVASGSPDNEVYLYDAEGAGRLVCTSCNPSGGRPVGREEGITERWSAASIPGWQNSLYASRVLSEDGNRLYFNSVDPLSPRDTNGAVDVYQWEAPGTGGQHGCRATDSDYSPQNGGCISLISSGQSSHDSVLRDASPSGGDVFFATTSSLLPQDYGLLDIYDARVEGGLPIPQGSSPSCEGEACQGPFSPPNDPTPASSAFEGPGNVVERQSKKKKKAHHKGRGRHRRGHHDRRHRR